MDSFINYMKNIDYFAIIDLAVIILVSVLLLIFFKRRNNLKLAVILAVYMTVFTAVTITTALTPNNLLFITSKLMYFGVFFILVALCVVYQQDLKALVTRLSRWKEDKNIITYANTDEDLRDSAKEIVKACQTLSKNDIGALIIIAPHSIPSHLLGDNGVTLNAKVSDGLLQSVFNTKSPLHDGAVVIKDNVILKAACFLQVTQRNDINKELGTRHRAAIGITEESDVLAIVVSEETGIISVVKNGVIKRYITPEKLLEEIELTYGFNYTKTKDKRLR